MKFELNQAIKKEKDLFEKFYHWLVESMPKIFFEEVSNEWISLIVHNLMSFKEQDFFVKIHLKNAAIVLSMDEAHADVTILEGFPMYGIKNYTTYVSLASPPFVESNLKLRIAIILFTDLSFGLSSSKSEKVTPQILGFFDEVNGPRPFTSQKSTRDASKLPEFEEEKHKIQVTEVVEKELQGELTQQIDPLFLRPLSPQLQLIALEMFERAQTRDHCQYDIQYIENWQEKNLPSVQIILAWKNVPKHNFLYRLARVVYQHNLVMQRVNAAYINPYKTNSIFLLSFNLHGSKGEAAQEAADISSFLQEMVMLKYFGSMDQIDATFVEPKILRGNLGNFLRTLMHFVHQVLLNLDPHQYTLENIEEGLCRHPELTLKLCEAFEYKFHPQQHDLIQFEKRREEFIQLVERLDTGHEYHDVRRKNILLQGMSFVVHILKTNFYCSNKTALAFRLDPRYLDAAPFDRKKIFPELPFGIFFIKGMHFVAFHVRFKDLARGGLRTVYAEKRERVLAERNVVFSECYHLAYTQHKKNKDIPEGGAKCVIFLKPYERLISEAAIYAREMREGGISQEQIEKKIESFKAEQKLEYLYQTQRSFIKNFLTLINCLPDGTLKAHNILDYWKKPEYIYLGPDENMHDSMIAWIAQESKKEKYKPGGAFISGKPEIGINHKEYGVTSLGVNTFMHEILLYLGINPLVTPFTVKMTGGPDGDVGGNQIYNLYRFYRHTAKLLALTDISGTIYDPQGLDLEVCVRLFHEKKSIRFYPHEKLSVGGFLLDRESKRESTPYVQQTLCWKNQQGRVVADWLSGNEMNTLFNHNVHQIQADIFLPCGGRPRTLRETNYKDFLNSRGEATSKAIVEGANLYLTPWARQELEERGVLIVKDSSANKGGVICSSFEILCSLTLTDQEFLAHKKVLVAEILERVQKCALDEARLMLETHKKNKLPLTELSEEISKRINHFTDEIFASLEPMKLSEKGTDPLIQCFLHYCPKTLRENFSKKLIDSIPENHKKAIIASHIASRLVYKRGLNWSPSISDVLPLILEDRELLLT